jgi:hypothetical protein
VCSLTTAEGDKWGLDVISRDVMRSEPEVGERRRNTLDATDIDEDDDWAEQDDKAYCQA